LSDFSLLPTFLSFSKSRESVLRKWQSRLPPSFRHYPRCTLLPFIRQPSHRVSTGFSLRIIDLPFDRSSFCSFFLKVFPFCILSRPSSRVVLACFCRNIMPYVENFPFDLIFEGDVITVRGVESDIPARLFFQLSVSTFLVRVKQKLFFFCMPVPARAPALPFHVVNSGLLPMRNKTYIQPED